MIAWDREVALEAKSRTLSIVPLTGRTRLLSISRHFVPGYYQMSPAGLAGATANLLGGSSSIDR
jgi:hypothetical protein